MSHPLNDPTEFGGLMDLHGISEREGSVSLYCWMEGQFHFHFIVGWRNQFHFHFTVGWRSQFHHYFIVDSTGYNSSLSQHG